VENWDETSKASSSKPISKYVLRSDGEKEEEEDVGDPARRRCREDGEE